MAGIPFLLYCAAPLTKALDKKVKFLYKSKHI